MAWMELLAPAPGNIVLDGTVGLGGHAWRLAESVGESGVLIGMDVDARRIERRRSTHIRSRCPFNRDVRDHGRDGDDRSDESAPLARTRRDPASPGVGARRSPRRARFDANGVRVR